MNADQPKASDFGLEYDFAAQELTITSTYTFYYTDSTIYGYIERISVYRVEDSDILLEEREYPSLTEPTQITDFSDTFQVTANDGDTLRARIWFNVSLTTWGSIAKTITADDTTTPTTTPSSLDDTTILVVAGLGGAVVVIILVAVVLRRR